MASTIFVIISVLYVLTGYVCAKCIQIATKKMWLGTAVMSMSTTFPLSLCVMHCGIQGYWLINILCFIGYISLCFFIYFFMYCAGAFVIRLFWKQIDLSKSLLCGAVGVLLLLCYGYFNAFNVQIKTLEIPASTDAKICFVSDIHVGSVGTPALLNNIVQSINSTDADLVIFGGDTLDLNAIPLYEREFLQYMSQISKPKLAVIGNHEIYANAEKCMEAIRRAGIRMLLDESQKMGELTIIGRIDATYSHRKPLNKIIPADSQNVIVVDHTPIAVNESVNNHVLLHLSGHTHGGQLFPFNIITYLTYKIETGILYHLKNTFCYVTPGAGFWGPPCRIGSCPEIVLVHLKRQ